MQIPNKKHSGTFPSSSRRRVFWNPFVKVSLILCMVLVFSPIMGQNVYAQANLSNSGDVTCPASGTSVQILPARSSRFAYMLNNINSVAVRVGYLDSPSTATLDATNSWVLQPGQAFADSTPNILSKRVVCMSTTAATNLISFSETFK